MELYTISQRMDTYYGIMEILGICDSYESIENIFGNKIYELLDNKHRPNNYINIFTKEKVISINDDEDLILDRFYLNEKIIQVPNINGCLERVYT